MCAACPMAWPSRSRRCLIGEAVRVLEDRGYWSLVRAERDGYIGWTRAAALHAVRSQSGARLSEVGQRAGAGRASRPLSIGLRHERQQVGALPFGAALPVIETRRGWAAIRLPDDRVWWVKETDLLPLADRPKPNAAGIAFTLDLIKPFVGIALSVGRAQSLWLRLLGVGADLLGLHGRADSARCRSAIPRRQDRQGHAAPRRSAVLRRRRQRPDR